MIIPLEKYQQILELVPIVCVDLLLQNRGGRISFSLEKECTFIGSVVGARW